MFENIMSAVVCLLLVGVLVTVLIVLIKIDERRYKEHKEFKDNILKEVKRYNDLFDNDIKEVSNMEVDD